METAAFDVADGGFGLGTVPRVRRCLELADGSDEALLVQCITSIAVKMVITKYLFLSIIIQ